MTLKKEEKTDFWKLIFIIIPAILFGKIANLFIDKNIAYTVTFTILGIGLGYLLYFLSKNKPLTIKIICLTILLIIPFSSTFLSNKTQREKEWIVQKIDNIEFSSPFKVNLIDSQIPDELKEDYNKLNIYSDNKKEKSTIIYSIEISNNEIDLESYFNEYLESFKTGISDLENIEVKKNENKNSENNFIAKLKFIKPNTKPLNGFCRLIKRNNSINLFWLIPLSKGYPEKYIEKFNKSIEQRKL